MSLKLTDPKHHSRSGSLTLICSRLLSLKLGLEISNHLLLLLRVLSIAKCSILLSLQLTDCLLQRGASLLTLICSLILSLKLGLEISNHLLLLLRVLSIA